MSDVQSRDGLDAFGKLATLDIDPTIQAGRYSFQAAAERRVLGDVLPKLQLEPHHRVLDIGCGSGILTIPVSFLVREIVALDHPDIVAMLQRRFVSDRISYVGGRFPEALADGEFDRVIAYSVLPSIETYDLVKEFALAAARFVRPGGRLLLGDIPNRDRQARFRASETGKAFEVEWAKLREGHVLANDAEREAIEELSRARQLGGITDAQMCDLLLALRDAGCEAYLVEQHPDLPFGRTREDIVVTRA